jgi:hypothetical protein
MKFVRVKVFSHPNQIYICIIFTRIQRKELSYESEYSELMEKKLKFFDLIKLKSKKPDFDTSNKLN